MKVLGLVVEYNPFHNGHAYHLAKAKELSGADYVVCVMSGNFIQRGEPAIVNKWARAKMALLSGVDLVIELPVVYAAASAEYFSYAAVKLLDSLGFVDFLCFGSEHGDITELNRIAALLLEEPSGYKEALRRLIATGISYPAAREKALIDYFSSEAGFSSVIKDIIGSSNNILGIEYLKALKRLNSNIIPLTVRRVANSYNSPELTGCISSATSIRKHINASPLSLSEDPKLSTALPDASRTILEEEFQNGRGPVYPKAFEELILYTLRSCSKATLASMPYISEGIENRIKAAADNSGSLDKLVEAISTKRYTRTRVQRILFNSLLAVTSEEFEDFNKYGGPQYIRIFGFNAKGRKLLSEAKKKASLPVIMKTADYRTSCNPLLKRMLELETKATDIYVLGYNNPLFRKAGQEFTQNVVILR